VQKRRIIRHGAFEIHGGHRGTGCPKKTGLARAIQIFEPLEKIFEFFVDKCVDPKYHAHVR
jgi:hypothetical protein